MMAFFSQSVSFSWAQVKLSTLLNQVSALCSLLNNVENCLNFLMKVSRKGKGHVVGQGSSEEYSVVEEKD